MIDLLCVGSAVFDITMFVDHHPEKNEKCFARRMTTCGGGPAATAAVTAVNLGGSSALAAYLGTDFGGEAHFSELLFHGVKTDFIIRGTRPTPVSTIIVKPGGDRTVINYKEGTPPLSADSITIDTTHFGVLLFDGHEPHLSMTLRNNAGSLGIPTVLDAGSLHQGTELLASKVDYLVASEKFAREYTGCPDPRSGCSRLAEISPCAVVTMGDQGLVWQQGSRQEYLPAFPVQSVDTTGAGDIFHGAFALGVAQGMDIRKNLLRASATAALGCTKEGARSGIPTLWEVQEFLSDHPD